MESNEKNLALRDHTVSSAAARVTELAAAMQFTAVPTAPRTYQLTRKRRRKLRGSVVEMMTVTLVEDRSGTRARVTGDLDEQFLRHLAGPDAATVRSEPEQPIAQRTAIASPPPVAPPVERREPKAAPVRPSAAPSGLIAAVPGASSRPASSREPTPPLRPRVSDEVEIVEEVAEHTVLRSSIAPRPSRVGPALLLPDRRSEALDEALLIGRQPSADAVGVSARTVAVADPSVSKTHALMAIEDGYLVVTDLHSSNGTSIELPDRSMPCPPGEAVGVELENCIVRCGDAELEVTVSP